MAGFFDNVANAVQGVYHQVNPWDNNRTFDTNAAGKAPGYRQVTAAPTPKPTPIPNYDPSGKIAASNAALEASRNSLAAIQAQMAAMPRIQAYDTTAAYANAQKTAQGKVDPVYADKLNQYLQGAKLKRDQETRTAAERQADIANSLSQTNEDIARNRTRTAEDEATSTGDVALNETNFQENSGTAFDRARTALIGNLGSTGADQFGLGQNQVQQTIDDRNSAENQQTQQFDTQRRDIKQNAFRTFEDLETSGVRASGAAETGTKRSKQALQDFIDNASLEEQGTRVNLENERQGALFNETQNQYKVGAQQFIASLVGKARDQDIIATKQFLGI